MIFQKYMNIMEDSFDCETFWNALERIEPDFETEFFEDYVDLENDDFQSYFFINKRKILMSSLITNFTFNNSLKHL